MFTGAIVWRGIVYTVLMTLAKFACGFWLVRLTISPTWSNGRPGRIVSMVRTTLVPHFWGKSQNKSKKTEKSKVQTSTLASDPATATLEPSASDAAQRNSSASPAQPFSIHPATILALAMCARGEIGFLISGVAESKGIFVEPGQASDVPSDIFLVVTWAIVLCTIIGPLGVGLCVRRVKTLEERKNRQQQDGGRDVLGVWGVK